MNGPGKDISTVVKIDLTDASLEGVLDIPMGAQGIVVFSHGSGSGRLSPRNGYVAEVLHQAGLATLLVDLLTEEEDQDYERRFDINILTRRLVGITDWLAKYQPTSDMKVGYFGASTGAAAALQAAASSEGRIAALVSRGGRVDLAPNIISVTAPTLLIVGSHDYAVAELNEEAYLRLTCHKELAIIPQASHLFEEPGTLERVAELSAGWFKNYLGAH